MLLRDFVNGLNITTECKLAKDNENGFDWRVTLKLDGRAINIKFHCGRAWQEIHKAIGSWRDATWEEIKKYGKSNLFVKLRPKAPSAYDVLQSLHSDSQTIDDNTSFREWANEFGFNPDSIAHRKIYCTCLKDDCELRRLLLSRYSKFMACEGD